MNRSNEHLLYSYSWHQSHDQATVLLLVPYGAQEEDIEVVIGRNYLVAGVRGQSPIVKGRLYGNVEIVNSLWQLEPRPSQTRVRTISTASSISTPSSYAFVSDPEISSSFAASLESGHVSDVEDVVNAPSNLSSPASTPIDVVAQERRHASRTSSRPVSPGHQVRSLASSFSSLESLQSPHSSRLLTLHLEKEQPVIWPSLIIGPVTEAGFGQPSDPQTAESDPDAQYNMDPTSLVLIALELYDIRKDKDAAFEYLVRAWRQARVPVATMRLVSYYVPPSMPLSLPPPDSEAASGTTPYYVQCLGGPGGLAQLYLEAGLLHLEGAATFLLSSTSSTLSSVRMPAYLPGENSTEAWRHDRDAANRCFERARALHPDLDVPLLPPEAGPHAPARFRTSVELEMPSIDLHPEPSAPASTRSENSHRDDSGPRRRRKDNVAFEERKVEEVDSTWYLYIPGLVGAGTAILVVGVVGALSLTNWRRGQGS